MIMVSKNALSGTATANYAPLRPCCAARASRRPLLAHYAAPCRVGPSSSSGPTLLICEAQRRVFSNTREGERWSEPRVKAVRF